VGVIAGSTGRNKAIVTGIVGAMLGLLFGISITAFAVSARERDAAATGPGRAAGVVQPWLFEAPAQRGVTAASGRGAGLVDPSLFEAPAQRGVTAASGRGAGLVDPSLFEAPAQRGVTAASGRGAGLVDPWLFEAPQNPQ
jgi:hypothetical protein